jgi:transcription antitermination factor NusG
MAKLCVVRDMDCAQLSMGDNLSTACNSSDLSTYWTATGAVPLTHVNWYAVYTRPSHEKRVAERLASRGIECYLPSYRTIHQRKNRCKVQLELPLFPCYVFVRFRWEQHVRVREDSSVVSIVGNGREPLPLQHSEMTRLREGLEQRHAEPHPYLNIGERARIKRGPLTGFDGIVARKNNGLRVILTLREIMKSVAVEVDECDLELLGN